MFAGAADSTWGVARTITPCRSRDEQPLGAGCEPCLQAQSARAWGGAAAARAAAGVEPFQACQQGLFLLPVQYTRGLGGGGLLICGWMGTTFMLELLAELDHSDQACAWELGFRGRTDGSWGLLCLGEPHHQPCAGSRPSPAGAAAGQPGDSGAQP